MRTYRQPELPSLELGLSAFPIPHTKEKMMSNKIRTLLEHCVTVHGLKLGEGTQVHTLDGLVTSHALRHRGDRTHLVDQWDRAAEIKVQEPPAIKAVHVARIEDEGQPTEKAYGRTGQMLPGSKHIKVWRKTASGGRMPVDKPMPAGWFGDLAIAKATGGRSARADHPSRKHDVQVAERVANPVPGAWGGGPRRRVRREAERRRIKAA